MNHRLITCFRFALTALAIVAPASILRAQVPGLGTAPAVLTIDDAVKLALERNLSIALAQSQVESSSARVTGAFGTFLPQINLSGGYNKRLSNSTTLTDQSQLVPNSPDNSLSASAGASLQLFDGFSRSSNFRGAQYSYDASRQSLQRTKEDIIYQTRAAYLNALRAEQIIDIRQSDLDFSRERLAQNKELVEVGTAQIGVVYSQEAEVANAELSLEQARTDVVMARNNLLALLNLDPVNEPQLSSEGLASSVDSAMVADARQQLGASAVLFQRQGEQRLDIKAAKLRLEAAAMSVTAAKAGYYPSISTTIGWNWQKYGDIPSSSGSQFGLNLQYTPFDGFRTKEQVELAEANRQSAEIDLRRLEIQARSDLRQTLARLDGAERQLRAADKAVASAKQNRYAANERYRLGAGSFTDVLLANSQFLTAQINQVNAVFSYRLALYEVRYQAGE
ncbi:MAG: TolC family protein [Candidatus Kapaibacterium sp.]